MEQIIINSFIMFWEGLGINSGQIQVVLNLIVIVLASIAALYAKKQIIIAQRQREDDIRLSKYRLKLSILKIAYKCKTDFIIIRQDFDNYKNEFIKLLKSKGFSLNDLMPTQDYTFAEYLEIITAPLDRVEKTNTNLIYTLNEDNSYSDLSSDDLENYLKSIMSIASSSESTKQGLTKRIEEMKILLTR